MTLTRILFISLSVFFLSAADGFSFRCGNGLVTTGDSKIQVQETCGRPSSKEIICPRKTSKCPYTHEVWYYNCGANDYIYALTFEDGKLTKETTEGSGSGKSNCQGK